MKLYRCRAIIDHKTLERLLVTEDRDKARERFDEYLDETSEIVHARFVNELDCIDNHDIVIEKGIIKLKG